MKTIASITVFFLLLAGSIVGAEEAVQITLKTDDPDSHATREQLLRLLEEYDLSRWIYTREVQIESGAGLLASLGNRLLLRAGQPNQRQIQFWDRRLVTLSRHTDRLLGFRVGKSVLGIWSKNPGPAQGRQ